MPPTTRDSLPPRPEIRPDRVDRFVRRHFGLTGSLRLHRSALGWDLLRAPLNVALAPVFLLVRIASLLLRAVGLRRAADALAARRILLRTDVATRLEGLIAAELLDGAALNPQQQAHLHEHVAVRSAVSEITTCLITLTAGFLVFHVATPGVISLAPTLSRVLAESQAVASFPLGAGLGRVWYGLFPPQLPTWYVVCVGVALAMLASLVTTFAGIVADPVQAGIGLHRRRLVRLLAAIDTASGAPATAREHYVARLADVTDAVLSIIRFFRS